MSKLIKLYQIILNNATWLFLFLLILFFNFSTFSQGTINNEIKTIVIDPGHGGKDPGTMGTKRYSKYEKDIALSISLKLGKYISDSFPNINVIYTRNRDVFLELNERTEIANKSNSDLFISVHCDGFSNPKAFGASVFVMGMSKLKANLDVAMRENAAIYLEDDYISKYDGFDPKSTESYIVFNLMQNAYLSQSLKLAEEVEHEFATMVDRKSRGVKQAPFYVISRTNMPSVLIECGFLTNPVEEDLLQTDKGQNHIASAIFRAFISYKVNLENADNKSFPMRISSNNNSSLKNISSENKLIYKVQIGTYLKSMAKNITFMKLNAEEQVLNGTFKYFVGAEINKLDADKIKSQMIAQGYSGAFVVAFYKDVRVSIQEALNLQTKTKNNE